MYSKIMQLVIKDVIKQTLNNSNLNDYMKFICKNWCHVFILFYCTIASQKNPIGVWLRLIAHLKNMIFEW